MVGPLKAPLKDMVFTPIYRSKKSCKNYKTLGRNCPCLATLGDSDNRLYDHDDQSTNKQMLGLNQPIT